MMKTNRFKQLSMKALLSFVFSVMCIVSASAQQKQFTLNDLLGGGESYWNLRPENVYTSWWGNLALKTTPNGVYDLNTGKEILTVDQVNKCFSEKVAFSAHNFSFPLTEEPVVMFTKGQRRIMLDFHACRVLYDVTLPEGAVTRDFNIKSRNTAYTIGGNLYVFTANSDTLVVSQDGSTDGSDDIVYGQSVHRDEFGISGGTFWSPDGKTLAYYRMDQSMVTDYPQVNLFTHIATHEPDKYPMAGQTSHEVTVGVYDVATGTTLYLKAGDPKDRYFTNVAWSPDSKTIYIFDREEASFTHFTDKHNSTSDFNNVFFFF